MFIFRPVKMKFQRIAQRLVLCVLISIFGVSGDPPADQSSNRTDCSVSQEFEVAWW